MTDSANNEINNQARATQETARPKVEYEVGDTVTVTDGPFENFEGVVENVDMDRGKLQLSVSIFGRSTPLEVEFWQVERN